MNEERQRAYLNLINALLNCVSGEELNILNANPDLIDNGLVQMIEKAIAVLVEQDQQNPADFLTRFSNYLSQRLELSKNVVTANPEEYLIFLGQVLKVTRESEGNPQEVYPLLRSNLDKLDDLLVRLLRAWATAILPSLSVQEADIMARVIFFLSNLLLKFPLGDKANKIEIVIAGYEVVIDTIFTREAYPEEWATVQKNLGAAYLNRIQGDRAENLEEAISKFNQALEVNLRERYPNEWAGTQINLGEAYRNRILGELLDNLEQAICHFNLALEIYSYEQFSYEWATIHNNLGATYSKRIQGEKLGNFKKAIYHFNEALKVYTLEIYPNEWATIQHNLGATYSEYIQENQSENIENAIYHYNEALQIRTIDSVPNEWATTQNNLGNSYCKRLQGDREENLELAINCYRKALQIRNRERLAAKWGQTQNNLGCAYYYRIRGNRAENIDLAIDCYREALKVRTREGFPYEWATARNNLGVAYLYSIDGVEINNIEEAIRHFIAALEIYTPEQFPYDWATTQANLGTAYCNRANLREEENLKQAIEYYKNTIKICLPDIFPYEWAIIQNNLGNIYREYKLTSDAIQHYKLALEKHTATTFPLECFRAAKNLGNIAFDDRRWREAIEGYNIAIQAVEQSREWSITDSRKAEIISEAINVYTNIIESYINNGQPDKATEYVERSKARNLVELLYIRDIFPKGNIPESVINKVKQLRREIVGEEQRLEIAEKNHSDIVISNIDEQMQSSATWLKDRTHLNELRQQLDNLITKDIDPIDPSFRATQKVEPISFEDIQKLLPDNQTAIIQWYILGDKFLTFIITQSSVPDLWQSEPADLQALNHWLDEYLEDYQDRKKWRDKLESRLHQLAEILHLEDILKRVPDNCQQVILIPHRLLHLLPLHAMPLPNQQDKCLLDKFPKGVRYAPSCQLLQLSQKQERPYLTHLFGIQNPTQDLTYASLQVQTICQHFDSKQVLVETAATKAALINDNNYAKQLRSTHCLHFACHGDFNEKSPLESYLKLANNELLSLGEIFSLDINQCRLVTLSACETGLTDHTSISDEYIGLPSGFLFAGSPSVVSSLWKVDELATAFLMIKFYENLRKGAKGEAGNVAIALKDAKIWLRDLTHQDFEKCLDEFMPQIEEILAKLSKGKRLIAESSLKQVRDRQPRPFASPYYWAGFIATGR